MAQTSLYIWLGYAIVRTSIKPIYGSDPKGSIIVGVPYNGLNICMFVRAM